MKLYFILDKDLLEGSFNEDSEISADLVTKAVTECRRNMAATTINAFVRGYLVRRLLRTEYVQRLIQTIHDTLLFLLKLSQEIEDDTPGSWNLCKLKEQLFQQVHKHYTMSNNERDHT